MKYITICICVFLLAGSSVLAGVNVGEMQLYRQSNEVVLKILADGPVQYTHEIAEANDGKPFRIVVDIFPAVHNFIRKDFSGLPGNVIKSIRSSQYSVKPTTTVRIVLDLEKTTVYRIEKREGWIYVYLPDENGSTFEAWSTKNLNKPKLKKAKKVEIASKSEPPKKKIAAAQKPEKKPSSKPVLQIPQAKTTLTFHKPESSSYLDWNNIGQEKVRVPLKEKPAGKAKSPVTSAKKSVKFAAAPKEKTKVEKASQSKSKTTGSTVQKKIDIADSIDSKKPAPEPVKVKSVVPVKKPEKQEKLKRVKKSTTAKLVDSGPAKSALEVSRKTEPVVEKEKINVKDKKSTSRFRRQPAFSAKLKGTIVAEFPKRLVIKYKPGISRDPFASLLNRDRSGSNSPMTKKIPDVETSRLVGVLESASGQNRALLEDIDGYGYILKQGDKVKKGYVSKIYSNKALFQLFEYGWSRTIALRLNEGR